jgi:hypothetical protein
MMERYGTGRTIRISRRPQQPGGTVAGYQPAARRNCKRVFVRAAGITKKTGSKFWHATYRDHSGRQRCKSTKETNPSKARRIAEEFERFAKRKVPAHRVREAIDEVVREHYRTEVLSRRPAPLLSCG